MKARSTTTMKAGRPASAPASTSKTSTRPVPREGRPRPSRFFLPGTAERLHRKAGTGYTAGAVLLSARTRMGAIIWLASYPKSGNTWLRAFLHNLLRNPAEGYDINQLDDFTLGE